MPSLKVLSPVLLCSLVRSKADVGGMAVEVEPFHQYPITYDAVWQMATEGQSDRMASDMEVCMKKEGSHWIHLSRKKMVPHDIHECSLNIYEDQTVDVSTVQWWVVRLTSGDSNVKDKLCPGWPCICLIVKWRVSWSVHPCKSVDYEHRTVYRAENLFQCISNDSDNIVISQTLCLVSPTDVQIGTEIPHASFSGSIEPIEGWRL